MQPVAAVLGHEQVGEGAANIDADMDAAHRSALRSAAVAAFALPAARHALRLDAGAVGGAHGQLRVGQEFDLLDHAAAAAELAGAGGIRQQLIAAIAHRILPLIGLDIAVVPAAGEEDEGNAVNPIGAGPAAAGAHDDVEHRIHAVAADPQAMGIHRMHRRRPGHRLVGIDLGEGAEQRVDDRLPRRQPQVAGGGIGNIEKRARREMLVDRAVQPLVHRDVRVDEAAQHEQDGGQRLRIGRVDRPARLARGAGEIGPKVRSLNGHGRDHLIAFVEIDPVILDGIGAAIDAVGNGFDAEPHQPLGIIEQLLDDRHQPGKAVFRDQLADPHRGDIASGGQRVDIGGQLARGTAVGPDHARQADIQFARVVELGRRDHQPFVEAFGGVGGQTTRGQAAKVRHDHHHAAIESRPLYIGFWAVMEDRPEGADIGRVDAAAKWIVGDQYVAVAESLIRMILPDRDQHAAQRRDMHLAEFGLGDDPAPRVEQGAGDLSRLADEGRAGAAGRADTGLLRHHQEGVLDDFAQYGIEHRSGRNL